MSDSLKGRLKRGRGPKFKLTDRNYRKKAWAHLAADFGERCAYSMRHVLQCGKRCMEVDHFNPTLAPRFRHCYQNLMLATRICNNFKQDKWPTKAQRLRRIRFLNPTVEPDYDVEIFEDPESHELVGITPAAKYHILMCDLNNPSFVMERQDRAAFARMAEAGAHFGGTFEDMAKNLAHLREYLERHIPPIKAPPGSL